MEKETGQALKPEKPGRWQKQTVICSCGARIPVDKVYCPRCGTRRPKVWRCLKCGKLATKECAACPQCGGKMVEILSSPEKRKKKNKRTNILIFLAVILALASIAAIHIISGKNNNDEKSDGLTNAIQETINNEMIEGEDLPINFQYTNAMLKAITFEVKSSSDAKGSAKVEFNYIDAIALTESLGEEEVTSDDYFTYCVEQINAGTAATATKEITVEYEVAKSEAAEVYNIVVNEEFIDILCGGAYFHYMDMLKEGAFE